MIYYRIFEFAQQREFPLAPEENRPKTGGERRGRPLSAKIAAVSVLTLFILIFVTVPNYVPPVFARKIDINAEMTNLKSKNYQKKTNAIHKLSGVKNNPEVVAEMKELLKTEKKHETRSLAVIAIGGVGGASAVTSLREIFSDENEDRSLRLDALEGLSRQRDSKEAFDALLEAVENVDPVIRRVAAGLLWHNYSSSESRKVYGILQKLLQDEDEEVRNSAKQMTEFKSKE